MSSHRFAVGQLVHIKNAFSLSSITDETYRITGTLPAIGDSFQYRIRSENERHERVTTEDILVRAAGPVREPEKPKGADARTPWLNSRNTAILASGLRKK